MYDIANKRCCCNCYIEDISKKFLVAILQLNLPIQPKIKEIVTSVFFTFAINELLMRQFILLCTLANNHFCKVFASTKAVDH